MFNCELRSRRISSALPFAMAVVMLIAGVTQSALAQPGGPVRGSIVEDRAAKKLLEAGDSRYEADEQTKAVEIWKSVIERYPRSKVRFDAHMRLGDHLLTKERAYDQARLQFEAVASEDNRDEDQRAAATLKTGVCWYEARTFGKCFKVMRQVIEEFPTSGQVNEAYYYIGLGHFQLGHYSRAIAALEKVGTALSKDDKSLNKVEAGKRLFVKIEDADLAALEAGETVKVEVRATSGDVEEVECLPVGRNVRLVLGSITTDLGKPKPGNGRLEVKGDDKVDIIYIDRHTADRTFNEKRLRTITVVGNGLVKITDGAYLEALRGVVLGKQVNVQITDADLDTTDNPDKLAAVIEVYRQKTEEEIEAELAEMITKGELVKPQEGQPLTSLLDGEEAPKIDRYKRVDSVKIDLTEAKIEKRKRTAPGTLPPPPGGEPTEPATPAAPDAAPPAEPLDPGAKKDDVEDFAADVEADAKDDSTHSGVFRTTVSLEKAEEPVVGDGKLQALPGDLVRVTYVDKLHTGEAERQVKASAKTVEGNLGGVRVTRAQISDEELRLKTKLRTASALTQIGNRYKEFGLAVRAQNKYDEALVVCEEIVDDARKLGGQILEETYVQLWRIYFEMDKLNLAAAMAGRLQREFPNSGYVDEAMLQLGRVAQKKNDFKRAVSIYNRIVNLKTSSLRGEAQFQIAECYEQMAKAATENSAQQLFDRAFQEYKKVFDQYPESGRVGEAVAKMAAFYYQKKDYARAVDVFEAVLADHPDAKFLDVILFNYGRCLYRMNKKREARTKFDQLIGDFPESPLAGDAKRISDALVKGGF